MALRIMANGSGRVKREIVLDIPVNLGFFVVVGERGRTTANEGIGGRGGIRTHEGLAPLAVFKTAALNHSATLPYFEII